MKKEKKNLCKISTVKNAQISLWKRGPRPFSFGRSWKRRVQLYIFFFFNIIILILFVSFSQKDYSNRVSSVGFTFRLDIQRTNYMAITETLYFVL